MRPTWPTGSARASSQLGSGTPGDAAYSSAASPSGTISISTRARIVAVSRRVGRNDTAARWLDAELESAYAVAYAALSDLERSARAIAFCESVSSSPEARVGVAAARAIQANRSGEQDEACHHARSALLLATSSGMLESLVSAYRGCPELVATLLGMPDCHDMLSHVLEAAGDNGLDDANAILRIPPFPRPRRNNW